MIEMKAVVSKHYDKDGKAVQTRINPKLSEDDSFYYIDKDKYDKTYTKKIDTDDGYVLQQDNSGKVIIEYRKYYI